MNAHHAVVDLAAVAVVLATDSHGVLAALGRPRLVHAADRFGVRMLFGDDLLAAISELLFIPFDRFEQALQRPRRRFETQGDGLRRLAVQVRQLALHINSQQVPSVAAAEAIGEQRQKQTQLPSQCGNLF
jgi:hypothetical protein